jgi:hypothetical protein
MKNPIKSKTIQGIIATALGVVAIIGAGLIPAFEGLEAANAAPDNAAAIVKSTLESIHGVIVSVGAFVTAAGTAWATFGRAKATEPLGIEKKA